MTYLNIPACEKCIMSNKKKHILVTGSHRSGSTWAGKVIASAPGVHYVHEPFNISAYERKTPFHHWFAHVSQDIPAAERRQAKHYIESSINVNYKKTCREILHAGKLHKVKSVLANKVSQQFAKRQLIKDPIAIMSAEWLAETFDMDVIVLIRHPAAFAASLKVKSWTFDFHDFLAQERLMNNYLFPFREAIEKQASIRHDIVEQAILLWNCIHHVIHLYKEKHPKWIFVRHEDLSANPLDEFKSIFQYLNLKWNGTVKRFIVETTRVVTSSEYKLSAKDNILSWKKRLTHSEIERVKEGTKSISKQYYSDKEW